MRFIIRAIRYFGSSGKAVRYNHGVYVGWCSSTDHSLCEKVLATISVRTKSSASIFLQRGLLHQRSAIPGPVPDRRLNVSGSPKER
ncbi:hypothetical protein TNCV_845561 [Trichonephila clavipes]|nr:hypothetical protein TNCV_845561 [Trichonephila clavipes]